MASYLFNQFAPRERQILDALCRGWPTVEIACRLGISVATVRSLIRTLLCKTGTKDRNSLVLHVITRDRRVHYLNGCSVPGA